MKRPSILVSLDLTDATGPVLREARQLARAYHARIQLLHVGLDVHRTGGMEFELPDYVRAVAQHNQADQARLARCARLLNRDGFPTGLSIAEGDACKALLAEARKLNPAAIVIGAHAHGALHGMFFGAVRRSLVNSGAWPVLVVPVPRRKRGRGTGP